MATYTLTAAQLRGQGILNFFEIPSGSAPPPSAPVNTVAPAITGIAEEGETVLCSTGTWTGTLPITYTYQWYRGIVAIPGETSDSYIIINADVFENIGCIVTATNIIGSTSANSNTIIPVDSTITVDSILYKADNTLITADRD
jgi:hypothetical protein